MDCYRHGAPPYIGFNLRAMQQMLVNSPKETKCPVEHGGISDGCVQQLWSHCREDMPSGKMPKGSSRVTLISSQAATASIGFIVGLCLTLV